MADFIRAEIDQRSSSGCPFLPLVVTAAAAALSVIVQRFDSYEKGLLAAPAAARLNTAALNAVNDTVRELRRCQGPRAAAKALPGIYAMVGLTIEPHEHPQGELAFAEKPEPTEDES